MIMMFLVALVGMGEAGLTAGPTIGCLRETGLCISARAQEETTLQLRVFDGSGEEVWGARCSALELHDLCLQWWVGGLEPATNYDYVINDVKEPGVFLATGSFMTQAPPGSRVPSTIAFASCAKEEDGSAAVWERMRLRGVDALVLLGDTPYIDTTDLAHQRKRYREFANVESFAALVRETPLYATWDDHDFGANDTDGRLEGKENSRRAFLEYRPNHFVGHEHQGIYTSFRVGDVDVFLLDARWFAATEPSPFDDSKPTLLGAQQWKWLKEQLQQSNATFKVISTGMIFNDAVRPFKTDYWGHYPHERAALFELIGELGLEGVVLVGGDIHRHRIVQHDSKALAGYDLVEFISSPVHDSIIATADAPHPGLLLDIGVGNIYLELEADTSGAEPVLTSRYVNAAGEVVDQRMWMMKQLRAETAP